MKIFFGNLFAETDFSDHCGGGEGGCGSGWEWGWVVHNAVFYLPVTSSSKHGNNFYHRILFSLSLSDCHSPLFTATRVLDLFFLCTTICSCECQNVSLHLDFNFGRRLEEMFLGKKRFFCFVPFVFFSIDEFFVNKNLCWAVKWEGRRPLSLVFTIKTAKRLLKGSPKPSI
jgi:hypothetical protein